MTVRDCRRCGQRLGATTQVCPRCGAPTPLRSAVLDATDPAPVGARVRAATVDLLPTAVLLIGSLVTALLSAVPWWVAVLLLGSGLAWLVVCAVSEGTSERSPGRSMAGLRVVDEATGRPIGVARAGRRGLGRLLVSVGTVGVAGLSYRWDPAGLERTWWDRWAGSRVIGGAAEAQATPAFEPGAGAAWSPVPPAAGPSVVAPPAPSSPRTSPPRAPAPAAAGPGQVDGHQEPGRRPGGGWRPAAPAGVAPGPVTGVASDPDRTRVVRRATVQAAAEDVEDPTRVIPRPEMGDPTADRITDVHADPAGRPDDASGDRGEPEDADATVARRRDRPRPATATLEWDSGARVVVGGDVLIGRDPTAADGESIDRRLMVGTDSVGVSKTHLQITITTAGITVVDRYSTNGVRVDGSDGGSDDDSVLIPAGEPVPVREGDRIRFGGRWIRLLPHG